MINRNVYEDFKLVKRMIEETNSVIIHIRGGDFKHYFNLLTKSDFFYSNAVAKLESILGADLDYFIFTDDPELSHDYLDKIPGKNFHFISEAYRFTAMDEF